MAARSSGSGQKMTRSASQPASCLAGNSPRASAGSHSPMVRFRLSEDMSPSPSPRARNSGGRTSHGSAPTRAAATTSSGSARGASPTSRSSPERSPRGPNYPKGSDPPYPPHQPEVRLVMEPGTYKAPDELHRELVRPAGVHGVLAIMATAPRRVASHAAAGRRRTSCSPTARARCSASSPAVPARRNRGRRSHAHTDGATCSERRATRPTRAACPLGEGERVDHRDRLRRALSAATRRTRSRYDPNVNM